MKLRKGMEKLNEARPGSYIPVVDHSRCKGCGLCVDACPDSMFEMRTLNEQEMRRLPFFKRLRVSSHNNQQAFVVKPGPCKGCGLCIDSCRERAIKLRRSNIDDN